MDEDVMTSHLSTNAKSMWLRWRRVGELGTEAGLREAGCSEATIAETLRIMRAERTFRQTYAYSLVWFVDDAPAVLLATIGRGITSHFKSLSFESLSFLIPHNLNELIALCVNLSSNDSNIVELDLTGICLFAKEGFTVLSTALELNSSIQTIKLSHRSSDPGFFSWLMRELRTNETVTVLDLSGYELTREELEAVAQLLCANRSLERLDLSQTMLGGARTDSVGVIDLASAALDRNTCLEALKLGDNVFRLHELDSNEGFTVLSKALRLNSSIQTPVHALKLSNRCSDPGFFSLLMRELRTNETVITLDLSGYKLTNEELEAVAQMLGANHSLKRLDLSRTMLGGARTDSVDVIHLASALERNTCLEALELGDNVFRLHELETLLQPLCQKLGDETNSSNGQKNTTLTRLDIGSFGYRCYPAPIATLIRTSKTLLALRLTSINLTDYEWHVQLLAALKESETLEELDLSFARGINEDFCQDLVRLLQFSGTGLRRIDLEKTGVGLSWQGAVDEEIRLNIEYRDRLRSSTQVPTTSGRLVLCGYEFAGKTAIRKTIERLEHGFSCNHASNMGWKKVQQAAPRLRRLLFGRDAHRELTSRTRGFDVLVLHQQPYLASVWDFAGHKEYYALHDYLFPNGINSCFLYVCSSRMPPDVQHPRGKVKDLLSMRDEFEYWMRFIASNSKPRLVEAVGQSRGPQLPQVRFVLTMKDTLDREALNLSTQQAGEVVEQLRHKFKNVICICETVEVVNAHSLKDVGRLMTLTNDTLKEILNDCTEFAVCKAVRNAMEAWSAENPSKPVLGMADFKALCSNQIAPSALLPFRDAQMHVNTGREAVLAYLNDAGDLIFPKGLDFVVANPRWFGVGVLGSLIDAFGEAQSPDRRGVSLCSGVLGRPKRFYKLLHKEGFVKRENITGLLNHSLQTMDLQQAIPSAKLVQLMIHLELCFEEESGKEDSSLFIPALFDDDTESAAKGRRKLEWNLETCGPSHYLGRRLECENKSITFLTPGFFPRLQVHVRNYLHEKKWTENPGFRVSRNLICFAENGVEVCVEYSGDIDYFVDILVRSSKPYGLALQFIQQHVMKKIVQFCASPQGCQGVHLVEAVIRPACVRDLYLCADRKAHSVSVSVLQAHVAEDDDYEHIWSQKIEDVKDTNFARDLLEGEGAHSIVPAAGQQSFLQEISGSRMAALARSDELMCSVEQQLPRYFYPSMEDVGLLRKLEHCLNVAKVMPIKLHLMCDHKDGSHKVQGQPGRTMRLKLKADSYDLPMAKLAITLLWAGVGAATASAGAPLKLPLVDKWIQSLFNVRGMPDISAETLHELMCRGETGMPVSEQEILTELERYWKIDPYTAGLKNILDLQDVDKFWEDFRLRKVLYIEPSHRDRIGWVCKRHYKLGLQESILQSVPLT